MLISLLSTRVLGLDCSILHLNCLIVVLSALVVGWQYAASQQGAFGFQFEFPLFAEAGEAGGFAGGAFAGETFGLGESTEGGFAGAGGVGGLAFAPLGQFAGLARCQVAFPREPGLSFGRFSCGAFRRGAGEFGGGLLGSETGQFGFGALGILLGLQRTETMGLGFDPSLPPGFALALQRRGLLGGGQTRGAFAIRAPAVGAVAEDAHCSDSE